MTDFRALCAELVDEAIYLGSLPYDQDPDPDLLNRARSGLAQPEGAAKEEWFADFAAWMAREMPAGTVVADPLWWAPRIARAILARWGRPAPQPIPIAERLPGEGDCDASYRCWFISALGNSRWNLDDRTSGLNNSFYTHWLPHWALSLPESK